VTAITGAGTIAIGVAVSGAGLDPIAFVLGALLSFAFLFVAGAFAPTVLGRVYLVGGHEKVGAVAFLPAAIAAFALGTQYGQTLLSPQVASVVVGSFLAGAGATLVLSGIISLVGSGAEASGQVLRSRRDRV